MFPNICKNNVPREGESIQRGETGGGRMPHEERRSPRDINNIFWRGEGDRVKEGRNRKARVWAPY